MIGSTESQDGSQQRGENMVKESRVVLPGQVRSMVAPGDTWYFLLPDGSLYSWGGSIEASTFMLVIGQQYYDNPAMLANAATTQPEGQPTLAQHLDEYYGLYLARVDHYFDCRGLQEKYVRGEGDDVWFYILPNGDFYGWGGSIEASVLIATIDQKYYEEPALLLDAASPEFVQELDLRVAREDHYYNFRGLGEKYFLTDADTWYYILPDGRLYHWGGSIEQSTLMIRLGVAYYDNSEMLLDPNPPIPPVLLDNMVSIGLCENMLTIEVLDDSFDGSFVEVEVSDGRLVDTRMFRLRRMVS